MYIDEEAIASHVVTLLSESRVTWVRVTRDLGGGCNAGGSRSCVVRITIDAHSLHRSVLPNLPKAAGATGSRRRGHQPLNDPIGLFDRKGTE